jgi:hypothetical protein
MSPLVVRAASAGNLRRLAEIGLAVSTVDTECLWEERVVSTRHRFRNFAVLANIFDAILVHGPIAIAEKLVISEFILESIDTLAAMITLVVSIITGHICAPAPQTCLSRITLAMIAIGR